MNKASALFIAVSAATAVAPALVAQRPTLLALPGPTWSPVIGAPYSGVDITETQQTLATGNQIQRRNTTKIYRDGQGRERRDYSPVNVGETKMGSFTSIVDPVAGFSYMLDQEVLVARKYPLHQPQGRRASRPRPGESREEDLGTQVINGFPATGKRVTTIIPAGAVGNRRQIRTVTETWMSTTLKIPLLVKRTDPRFGTSTTRLTDIKLGEPDPALFQVPANYKVEAGGPQWQGVVGGIMSSSPPPKAQRPKD